MPQQELDLVFCCDSTGSMGSYIKTAQENMINISQKIMATESRDLQFGLVAYRDHPPQDSTFVTDVLDLTPSLRQMTQKINTMSASGGGDGPESVACAMHAALNLSWRKDSIKVVVLIADAPPHGLEESGDGFPNGCPEGHDPIAIARLMAKRGIIVYSVGCEPAIGNYRHARAFFSGIAELTEGKYVSLGNAGLLPDVIIHGASEEFDMAALEQLVEEEADNIQQLEGLMDEAKLRDRVTENLKNKGYKHRKVEISMQSVDPSCALVAEATSLADAKSKVAAAPVYAAESHNYQAQKCSLVEHEVDYSSVDRVMKRGAKKKGFFF
eukprot:TRINITY_DN37796_c0_g1_i1.p1 TRINITY_DN37796_c0_g1~~TRINITY_DN37796_c0_g1_i1.p1  ORF type:complete len:326 (+),score=41.87 TRINITY_DN37796_c0_g1_i1:161-1138(+)